MTSAVRHPAQMSDINIQSQRSAFSMGVHWGYGIAWGALYGALHDRVPVLSKAAGLPFGVLFWLLGDEVMTTAMKLTPPPQAFPIDAHLRGLVGQTLRDAVVRRRASGVLWWRGSSAPRGRHRHGGRRRGARESVAAHDRMWRWSPPASAGEDVGV